MNILENVYIKDGALLNLKLKKIKEEGINNLHIISDFDKTLNKFNLKSGKFKSAISLIRDGNYLELDYPKRANQLYDRFHKFEMDLNLPFDKKSAKMLEWWKNHVELLSECKMHKSVIKDILSKDNIQLRENVSNFLKFLSENNIPILIFSSGIGQIISGFLEKKKLLFSNMFIISNFFDWDKNGFAKPMYKGNKIIHMLNKNGNEIKEIPYYNKIKDRKNIILLGDSLEDLNMSFGLNHNEFVSIGFLNENINERLEIYKDKFDIVITNDGTFDQVLELLKEII